MFPRLKLPIPSAVDLARAARQLLGSTLAVALMTTHSWTAHGQQVPTVPPAPTAGPSSAPPAPQATPTSPASVTATPGEIQIKPVDVTAAKQPSAIKKQAAAPVRTAPPPVAVPVYVPPPQVPIVAAPFSINPALSPQTAPGLPAQAAGQTVSTVGRDGSNETRSFSVNDILLESPGLSVKQGNGPRDMGVSIRGSNARNGFGVRNIQVFEDGFNVTQPDGLSRTDLTDPHAYGGIDVWRGPSSAMFGNYATGGAVNFRTRTGREINGFEYGSDFGSFGYFNNYVSLGKQVGAFEYSLFASDVRSDGHLDWNAFNTQTVNFLGSYTPTSSDKFTVKFIRNDVNTQLSLRLNMKQFLANPYQEACDKPLAQAAANCGSVSVFKNGYNGVKQSLTASEAGLGRNDHRTIIGGRWEHSFDSQTKGQLQYVFDDRDISQPTSSTSAVGDYRSHNVTGTLSHDYKLFGWNAKHIAGLYYNYLPADGDTFNVMPGGAATLGKLASNSSGTTTNGGARFREEIRPDEKWTFASGFAYEKSLLEGVNTNYTYGPASTGSPTATSKVTADRTFENTAWETGVVFRPNSMWQYRARVATAYGTPQFSNLFVQADGSAGNNTQLEAQTNIGYDFGFDLTPTRNVLFSATGFREYFRNELVSQSPVVGSSFTFNAPKSEHQGLELAADWRFLPGWRLAGTYTRIDQTFTEYKERLSGNAKLFDRTGNKIPGVSPVEMLARLGYDQPDGALRGLGAHVEYQWKDAFFMDNGNKLQAPGYDLVNLNVHYRSDAPVGFLSGFTSYFEVRNIFDKTYAASANNVTNSQAGGIENPGSVLAAGTGSIYAGMPRTFYGGVKMKF